VRFFVVKQEILLGQLLTTTFPLKKFPEAADTQNFRNKTEFYHSLLPEYQGFCNFC